MMLLLVQQLLIINPPHSEEEIMTTLRRCIELLERNGLRYVHTGHANAYRATEVAEAEHLPPYMLAKTIVVRGLNGYAMAVVPADCKVDLDELAAIMNLEHLRLATEVEIRERFPESEVGAAPPFGNLFGMPVYMDVRLTDGAYMFFNAGTHRDTIHMSVTDYIRLADPFVTRFAHPECLLAPAAAPAGG